MRVDFRRWPMQRLPAVPMGGAMCPQRMPPLLAVLRALERRWCGRGHRTIAGTVSLSFGRPFVAGQSDMSGLATSVACIAIKGWVTVHLAHRNIFGACMLVGVATPNRMSVHTSKDVDRIQTSVEAVCSSLQEQ